MNISTESHTIKFHSDNEFSNEKSLRRSLLEVKYCDSFGSLKT